MFIKEICRKWLDYRQKRINLKNRERLTNQSPAIISSNCLGGIMYHWLGLKFNSPFINLFFSNDDFIKLLENWDAFINTEIVEDKKANENYPVGIGFSDIRIHFMHYQSFEEAIEKWNIRKQRINLDNAVVIFSNFSTGENCWRDLASFLIKIKLFLLKTNMKNMIVQYVYLDIKIIVKMLRKREKFVIYGIQKTI